MPPRVEPSRRRVGRKIPKNRAGPLQQNDTSDAVRFSNIDAELATTSLDINAYGELNDVARRNHDQPATITASPFKWLKPASQLLLPQELQDRLGQNLNQKNMTNLTENDTAFRDLLKDVTSIREWWAKNREEWGFRRTELVTIQKSIDSLLVQVGGLENIEMTRHAAARKQYYLQVEVANSRLKWFEENEAYMKIVIAKFKDIQNSLSKTVEKSKAVYVMPTEDYFPDGFDYDKMLTSYQFTDGDVAWWENGLGLSSALRGMRKFLTNTGDDNASKSELRKASLAIVRQAIADVSLQWKVYGGDTPDAIDAKLVTERTSLNRDARRGRTSPTAAARAEATRKRIAKMEENKAAIQRIIDTNADYLAILRNTERRLVVELAILTWENRRTTGLLGVARKMERDLKDSPRVDLRFLVSRIPFVYHFYMTCRTHYLHQKSLDDLFTILRDDAFQRSDIDSITTMIIDHHAKFRPAYQATINKFRSTNWIWDNAEMRENMWYELEYEFEDMAQVVAEAEQLLTERTTALALVKPSEAKLRLVALGGPNVLNQPALSGGVRSGWTTITVARQRLAVTQLEVIGNYNMEAGEALRALFVSPDIAEYFRFTHWMKRQPFVDLVNSFLKTPVSDEIIAAFLVVCHDANDLFTINVLGRISYCDQGWELVHEAPVGGPIRGVRSIKPVGQDDLEKWLVKNKATMVTNNRDISARDLYNTMKAAFEGLTRDQFDDAMSFFNRIGRMYISPIDQPTGSSQVFRRIDNGWQIDRQTPYDPIFAPAPPYFAQLREILVGARATITTHQFRRNRVSETALFDLLEAILQLPGGAFGFGRVVVNRHRFHLFLRWCTRNESGFLNLNRSGIITGSAVV
ncbi:uncharacterized protein LY89DRAFT_78605 [Mollisia scopiformis]|uniref:Uncharacterized protein n=1 Tax=Mollisia scopiformis TaxID=149040 RepID=A0A194X904_MOLSC|nr:uncharacterized protein LY89DRAFT_78605 [Mollisia scopiformis]KUJ16267.1 hypothetical protein LY89DRAFT_78605 [Mollisia scopiformis]